jgi:LPS-assembly protein
MVLTEIEQPMSPPVLVEPPVPQNLVIPETGIPNIFPPAEPAPDGNVIVFNADVVRVEPVDGEEQVIANGNVTATYKNITVTSNTANYDSRTDIATFEENVTIRIDSQAIRGQKLSLTLPSRQYTIEGPSVVLPPSFFTSGVVEPLFLGAREISGVGRQRLIATDASFTTCNLEEPHYLITGSEVIVLPQQKIIVKKATFYALGHKIISLPRFVVPLRRIRERPNLIPQVGQSVEEGFFLKAAYNYLGSARQTGLLKLDLMSRKGLGQGIEHAYNLAKAAGTVYAYNLFDRTLGTRTFTGRLEHKQQLGDNIRANFTTDVRNNSYLYAPGSSSWISSLLLDRNMSNSNSNLAVRYDQETGFGTFNNLTSSLQHRQIFGSNTTGDFSFDYTASTRPVTTPTGETNATLG